MTTNDNAPLPDMAFFVALETRVWDALVSGDPRADADLLTPDFLGVYPSGFANRDDHAGQLHDGPVMEKYQLDETRLVPVGETRALLCYRARFRRTGAGASEVMYISSLWELSCGRWLNRFSQDTPAA